MLISEVEPIDKFGINLLDNENPDEIIDAIIELPLRNACKIFRQKGVKTVMSSANKNNVLKPGIKPTEKEDVNNPALFLFMPSPTYEDAGKGYAWIMLDFEALSNENKELLFLLESRTGKNGENVGEKGIWFVKAHDMRDMFGRDTNYNGDDREKEFIKRKIELVYNNQRYPNRVAIIRMPVNEETTVEEVDEYFSKFAKSFRTQIINKEDKTNEEPDDNDQISH
ncbi:MAG: hypothetical protein E7310_06740 [Clostridiales bacterium]|nr:hypothetical protein [Clostridiales bacterium]